METLTNLKGYQADFLGRENMVFFPRLHPKDLSNIAPVEGADDHILRYQNYSVVQNARRRLPFFAAANLHGGLFKQIKRTGSWRLDPRIHREHQWGNELYSAPKSNFDKGHMAKREDVQWGNSETEAQTGAELTFFFTNAVPQVGKLNQNVWRGLEDYILKDETVDRQLKISLFTGPVLSELDPVFVSRVNELEVKIPTLFWKVLYFTKSDGKLYRVGFLMGQEELLEKNNIIFPREPARDTDLLEEEQLFMDYKEAKTFQVNISTIEKLTRFKFAAAIEPFKDHRSVELIQEQVQTRSLYVDEQEYYIDGLAL